MNTYEIEGLEYSGKNEYDAFKQAYKMADRIEFGGYLGNDTWSYTAIFRSGKANVTVKKIQSGPVMSIEAAELMRFEGEWHNLAIWGDTRNQTWLPASLMVEA